MAMVKNPFNGNLNSNEIFSAIYNMIISQKVFADNVKGVYGSIVEKFRTDGSLYGDTKLFYDTDALKSVAWLNDAEATNLLALDRPAAPKCQAVTIDQFRQIRVSVDNYLSKRAWSTEGAFSSFNSVILGWIGDTKRIYDATLFNAFVGTVEGGSNKKDYSIPLSTLLNGLTGVEKDKKEAMSIAQYLADLLVELKDISRDFNDYKFLRSYDESDLMFIWNSKYINKIRKIDLPTIFHNEGLVDKFDQDVLPSRFFGTVITNTNKDTYADNTPTAGKPLDKDGNYAYTPGVANANGTVRTLVERDFTISGTVYHLFPGDELIATTKCSTVSAADTAVFDEIYIEDASIILKVVHKESFPFMSAMSIATSFFNPRSLTENHYLTFGYSKPDYLRGKPLIKVKSV